MHAPAAPSSPDASLLIVEIGNSHLAVATAVDREMRTVQRMMPGEFAEFESALEPAWESLPEDRPRGVAVASVVPALLPRALEALHRLSGAEPLVVGRQIRLPLPVALADPGSVGADRLCSAAAAFERIGRACAVASFGTATTIDCVNDAGVFLGGAILPGLAMQAGALHEGTAQLPRVRITKTTTVFGGDTEEAINVGIVWGAVGALRAIVERYATHLNGWPPLVVTGGFGPLIAELNEFVDALVPDLCLRGIALAYRRHFSNAGPAT